MDQRLVTILRYSIAAVIIVILGGLGGWYYFLHKSTATTTAQDTARGYGADVPSFNGSTGSTYQNVETTITANPSGANGSSNTGNPKARLWEVSNLPVAGFGWIGGTTSPELYFVERSSGYVLEADLLSHHVTRLTDTLRPKTYAALFATDGSVIERSIDGSGVVITFAGKVATSTARTATSSPDTLQGIDLTQNIDALAVDPVSRTIFYTLDDVSGATLFSSDWAGNNQKHLFSSALEGWRLYQGNGALIIAQKAADNIQGYAYTLQKNGSLSLLQSAPGLTVLPNPASPALLFASSIGGSLLLFGETNGSAAPTSLNVHTVADKCAWMPGGKSMIAYCAVPQSVSTDQFLNDWYKGALHTSDQFWQVDVSAASSSLWYAPSVDTTTALDVTHPMIDPSGQYVAFINATDQTLWILRIAQ